MKDFIIRNKKIYLLISIFILLLIWQIASFFLSPLIVPSPVETAKIFLNFLSKKEFWLDIFVSFERGLLGFFLAVIIGTPLGFLMGLKEECEAFFHPLLVLTQTTPTVSWLILGWLWFGTGDGAAAVFIIFIIVIPFIMVNVMKGTKEVDSSLMEMAQVFNFSLRKKIFYLYIPQIFPYFMAGCSIASGLTWKGVAMAELLTARSGIGAAMGVARINLEIGQVFVWTAVLIFLGHGFSRLFKYIELSVTKKWR
ncbi:MAG TPA: ABC transporter permease subunit [Defluviitaleaceae bacterium]|nr:ABC transporter permease subunit [Candidatus Epulonipiscium sp.]HOQ16343.1 ABC transporter permease subunit [Defluviitaleaceae bacterium]HPT75448.1 ABC transporter permease subunit [Defluviitaleaceae bacterium]HQD49647.1 ABC transporter permease subunit [Defluviitaleaceae bacterium]